MNFFDIFKNVKFKNNMSLYGMTDDFFSVALANNFLNNVDNYLIVTSTLYEANMLFKKINKFIDDVYLFPMDDFITSQAISMSPEMKLIRLKTLDDISNKPKKIVITNLEGILKKIPKKKKRIPNTST